MNFPFFIARRYFFSRRSSHIINRISIITLAGIAVGTTALIIVLSAFNGLDHLIRSLFRSFDADIRITATEGKSFFMPADTLAMIRNSEGVLVLCPVAEDNALLVYRDQEAVATIKGVPEDFRRMTGIDSLLVQGSFKLYEGDIPFGIMGQDIAWQLGVGVNFIRPVHVYVPRRSQGLIINPEQAFNHRYLFPSAIFSVQQEYDSRYFLVPFDFASELLGYKADEYTALEMKLVQDIRAERVKEQLQQRLGSGFRVETREDQHAYFYQVMKSEKWVIFMILGFILIIASFNTISSLTLLMIEKRQDASIIRSMGATEKEVRSVFLWEGWMVTLSGMAAGMVLGALLCWIQIRFGVIRFPESGSFVVSIYPVRMLLTDFLWVGLLVGAIGWVAARIPLRVVRDRYFVTGADEYTG